MKVSKKNILVIAPHPDDETLGVGGTMSRFISEGANVYVLVISGHLPPLYDEDSYLKTKKESKDVFKFLGVKTNLG